MLYGVDVSSHKPVRDIAAVKAAGNDFLITKATGGWSYVNPLYHDQINKARSVDMVVGHFHYLHESTLDPDTQDGYRSESRMVAEADHFLRHLDWRPGELIALDVEDPNVHGNLTACVDHWCRYVEYKTGVRPLIYTYPYYIKERKLGPELARYPLWYAEYNEPMQNSPAPWERIAIRQYTASATVPGIGINVDRNTFDGTREQLMALGTPPAIPGEGGGGTPNGLVTPATNWEGSGEIVSYEQILTVYNRATGQVSQRRQIDFTMGEWIELNKGV